MKKLNLPLVFGLIIILIIVLFMTFPEKLSSANPYTMEGIKTVEAGDKLVIQSAPFKPSGGMPLGSDEFGRDMYSLLVYGTRLTMTLSLLVVLGRFFVALPLGISAGFGSVVSKAIINQFNVIFSGIPALLIAIIILKMNFFTSMYKSQSVAAFIIVLTVVGWSRLGLIITERVKDILSRGFIKGEVAAGKSKVKIAIENVIPHLAPELVVLIFMEIALALTIIMQLGIFGVYVGNMRIVLDENAETIIAAKTSFEPEWASMLSTGRSFIGFAPWIILVPASAFILSIFGFNMFGEGIRMMLQKRDSKFTYYFRKTLMFSYDRSLYYSLTNYIRIFKGKKAVVAVISCLLITSLVLGLNNYHKSVDAKSENSFKLNLKDEIVIGTNEALEASKEFEKIFNEMGLKPLDDKGFIREYTINDLFLCTNSRLSIDSKNGIINLFEGKDYSLNSFGNFNISGKVYDATQEDLFSIKDFNRYDDRFIVIDSKLYSKKATEFFISEIIKKSTAKGVFCIIPDGEELPSSIGSNNYRKPSFWINKHTAKLILDSQELIRVVVDSNRIGNIGRNIIGMIPGEDPRLKKEAIIFGVGYNYMEKDKELGLDRINMALNMIKRLSEVKRDRTIILALWDGNISEELSGIYDYSKKLLYSPKDSVLYIDLTKISVNEFNELFYNAEQAPMSRPYSWSFKNKFEKNLTDKDISIKLYDKVRNSGEAITFGPDTDEVMFCKPGIPTIIVSTNPIQGIGKTKATLRDLEEVIVKTIRDINY